MTPARYVILVAVISVFAVLGVAQRTRAIHLGYRLEGLQEKRRLLADQNRQLLCDIGALSNPTRIAEVVNRSEPGLVDPMELTRRAAQAALPQGRALVARR